MFGDVVGCTVGVMLVTHGVGWRCRWNDCVVRVGLVWGEFRFEFKASYSRRVITHILMWVNAWRGYVRNAQGVGTHAPKPVKRLIFHQYAVWALRGMTLGQTLR